MARETSSRATALCFDLDYTHIHLADLLDPGVHDVTGLNFAHAIRRTVMIMSPG